MKLQGVQRRNVDILNVQQFVNMVLKWTKMVVQHVNVMIHVMVTHVRRMKSVLMLKKGVVLIFCAPQFHYVSQLPTKHRNVNDFFFVFNIKQINYQVDQR